MSYVQQTKPELVVVPGGSFRMGSTRESDPDSRWSFDEPELISVFLPEFSIGKFEVTVGDYRPFVEGGGYRLGEEIWGHYGWVWREKSEITEPRGWDDPVWTGDDRLPVVGVSWYEAMAYCRWLSAEMGGRYRLPIEAEWEKAARGEDGRIYPWGDTFDPGLCNCGRSSSTDMLLKGIEPQIYDLTVAVGSYPGGASPCGALDMSGNVWEWCLSKNVDLNRYPDDADPGKKPENQDPDSPDMTRVRRGGSYEDDATRMRTAFRFGGVAETQPDTTGFRVVEGGIAVYTARERQSRV